MPPPRRRRPVQPATRVRLPRSARPGAAPDTETPDVQTPASPAIGTGTQPPADSELTAAELPASIATKTAEPEIGESRDTGEPADTDLADTEPEEAGAADDEGTGDSAEETSSDGTPAKKDKAAEGSLLLPACLGAVAVTLGSLAVWFGLAAASTGNGVDTQNTALLDHAATAQVNQQIDKAFSTVFSYNYANTATTLKAAKTLLTGAAIGEYQKLFKLVAQDAPKEKLVLTTTVTNSGVEMLTGGRARVLIFANQQDTSASHQTTDAGAMLAINAVQQGGQWKIASIDTFSAGT
jgi:Mce-associated membrane protein